MVKRNVTEILVCKSFVSIGKNIRILEKKNRCVTFISLVLRVGATYE